MSAVSKSKGRKQASPPAQTTTKAPPVVVKSLTGEQIKALESVTGATIEKGDTTEITKDDTTHTVNTYSVSLKITKTINANSLASAAKNAVAIEGIAKAKDITKLKEDIASAAEKGTITKALKVLKSRFVPATKARLK
jgi:hypothetical protein|tara:strand:- start:432 stop:845 length:414 start_codon:yes stop_codon:yes gene_type:complete